MGIRNRIIAVSVSLLLAVGLVACSGSAEPEEVAVYQVEIQQPFVGREASDRSELSTYVEEASAIASERISKMAADAEEAELAAKVNAKFNRANESYREGDYAKAQKRYESVLKTYPLHYGANVNLTLALLQQESNEEALKQALVCVGLNPDDGALQLNVQAAGVACGFAIEDLEGAMDEMAKVRDKKAQGRAELTGDYEQYYTYNKLWDLVETDLYAAAQDAGASSADETDDEDATMPSDAVEEAATASRAYEDLEDKLGELEDALSGDSDVLALSTYLYAVGLQLGLEADPTLIEPMHKIPYIAADDELCTVRIAELAKQGDDWVILAEVTNKTEDDRLGVGRGTSWTVNGVEVTPSLSPVSIAAGEMGDVELVLSGASFEGDVTSFMGTIVVSSQSRNATLAHYPVSWSAEE